MGGVGWKVQVLGSLKKKLLCWKTYIKINYEEFPRNIFQIHLCENSALILFIFVYFIIHYSLSPLISLILVKFGGWWSFVAVIPRINSKIFPKRADIQRQFLPLSNLFVPSTLFFGEDGKLNYFPPCFAIAMLQHHFFQFSAANDRKWR